LIEKLTIISSYRKGAPVNLNEKRHKIERTFGLLGAGIELTEVGKDSEGKYKPYRWEVLLKDYPDFDIFIDDNPNIMTEAIKNIPNKNKVYVLPDYKTCRRVKGPNIYHVKTTVSDLTDKDFEITRLKQERESKASLKQNI